MPKNPPPEAKIVKTARFTAAALVLAAVFGGLAAISRATEPYGTIEGEKTPPVVVAVSPAIAQSEYSVTREFVGMVEARRESEVGFELGGEVAAILVEEGSFVEAGAVIARLDTKILTAERATLVAARDEARASVELAALTRGRFKKALASNAVSSQSYDQSNKDHQAKAAALARAEAAIMSIDTRIARADLKAPFPALVGRRLVDEGQVLMPGAPVVHLLERVEPEVRIGVAGAAIDSVHVGDRFELAVRKRRVPATVKAVLPVRGNGTRSVEVILTLHTQFNGIRRGDLATLELERARKSTGYWLPLSALAPSARGLWAVYVAEPLEEGLHAGSATHRIGRRELVVVHTEVDRVYARGTLGDGELVVMEGLQRLVPDQLVRLAGDETYSTLGAVK
jgi:RND family efflux transporter MFP subunit